MGTLRDSSSYAGVEKGRGARSDNNRRHAPQIAARSPDAIVATALKQHQRRRFVWAAHSWICVIKAIITGNLHGHDVRAAGLFESLAISFCTLTQCNHRS